MKWQRIFTNAMEDMEKELAVARQKAFQQRLENFLYTYKCGTCV